MPRMSIGPPCSRYAGRLGIGRESRHLIRAIAGVDRHTPSGQVTARLDEALDSRFGILAIRYRRLREVLAAPLIEMQSADYVANRPQR